MGDSSREASPDWLREFQTPSKIFTATISSSSSESLPRDVSVKKGYEMVLSSDSDAETAPKKSEESDENYTDYDDEKPKKKVTEKKGKKAVKQEDQDEADVGTKIKTENEENEEVENKKTEEKKKESKAASRLPLVFADKVHRTKALLECEDEELDLSGDAGAVGRLVVNKSSSNDEVLIDLKGTIFKTRIIPSHTFCVVNFGQTEAKVEAIMDDFVQLQPHSNVYENETMVEGTLEGFLFDSDDDGEKVNGAAPGQAEPKEKLDNGDVKQTKKSGKAQAGQKRKKADHKPASKGKGPKKQATSRKSKK